MTPCAFDTAAARIGASLTLEGRDQINGTAAEDQPRLRGLDKSVSPGVIQAPDGNRLSPWRSVGSRAAPSQTIKYFKATFGTVRYLFPSGLGR